VKKGKGQTYTTQKRRTKEKHLYRDVNGLYLKSRFCHILKVVEKKKYIYIFRSQKYYFAQGGINQLQIEKSCFPQFSNGGVHLKVLEYD
jgi:hypothetical protein